MEYVKITASGVMLQGETLGVGRVLPVEEIGKENAAALVRGRVADPCDADGKQPEAKTAAPSTDDTEAKLAEVREKQRKALDDQYKADELKDAAKTAGVEFAFDAAKKVVIAAIIDQGKADQLIK